MKIVRRIKFKNQELSKELITQIKVSEANHYIVFATIVSLHAFIFSHIDYCNSFLTHMSPQVTPLPFQSVLKAAAILVTRLPRFSHAYYIYYAGSLSPQIFNNKILLLESKSQFGLAPQYLSGFIHKPVSSTSTRALPIV